MSEITIRNENLTKWIGLVSLILIGFGVVMVLSSSIIVYDHIKFIRHLINLGVGLIGLYIFYKKDYKTLMKWVPFFMLGSFALLLSTASIKMITGGTVRWFWGFQPADIARFSLIIYFAAYIARKKEIIRTLKGFVAPIFVTGLFAILIFIQPDLSTTFMICLIVGLMMFLAGARWRDLIATVLIAGSAFVIMIETHPYQKKRLTSFLNPHSDPQDGGYQIIQSFEGLNAGNWFGVGLGNSTKKHHHLPASHTDFIVSIIGEELGFVITTIMLGLFLWLFILGIYTAKMTPDPFGKFLAYGIAIYIFSYAMINTMVAIGVFPVTGLPMPFVSYGGSMLAISMMSIGILMNISKSRTKIKSTYSGIVYDLP